MGFQVDNYEASNNSNSEIFNIFCICSRNIYIVMEYCNAGDLYTFIKKKTALPESTCKYFLRQLGLALKYMRSNNVSHFDLKPQNLLLMRHPIITLKIADFGFAQHLKLGQENRTIKGITIFYLHTYNFSWH